MEKEIRFITKEMLETGYDRGIVKLIISPNDDGVVCQIGEYWFYFSSPIGCDVESVEEYLSAVTKEEMIDEIYDSLDEFQYMPEMMNEYAYYEACLRDPLCVDSEEQCDCITKEMIETGYNRGVVRLIMNPVYRGVACQIGTEWFYLKSEIGEKAKSVEEYTAAVSNEKIIDEIYKSLDEHPGRWDSDGKYTYWKTYLRKHEHVVRIEIPESEALRLKREYVRELDRLIYDTKRCSPYRDQIEVLLILAKCFDKEQYKKYRKDFEDLVERQSYEED